MTAGRLGQEEARLACPAPQPGCTACVAPPHAAVQFTGPGAALRVADLCTCSPRGGCWSLASCLILNHRACDIIFSLACSLRSTPEAADPRTSRYTLNNSSSTQCTVSFLSFFLFFGGGGDARSPTPVLIPLTSAALPTGMHPCSPVQRLREVCVLMILPSLQERKKANQTPGLPIHDPL